MSLDWILSKPSPPHAGKGHCFRELTLSHTPHYGHWMGPGGFIRDTHLWFTALDYLGSLCSICFTRCHSGQFILLAEFTELSFSASVSNLDANTVNKVSYKTCSIQENYHCKSKLSSRGHTNQVIPLHPINKKLFIISQWLNMYVWLKKNRLYWH